MRKSALAIAMLAASLPSLAHAQSAAPLRLAPASDWSLNYADDACELSRRFGAGDNQVLLVMRSYQPGGEFFTSIIGRLTATAGSSQTIRVAMGRLETTEYTVMQGSFDSVPGIHFPIPVSVSPHPDGFLESRRDRRPIALWTRPEIEAEVSEIGLIDGLEQEFVMETGSMGPPLAALRECTSELSTHWTVNEAAHLQLARIAKPADGFWSWLEKDEYPVELRPTGPVIYRVIVDAEGKIAECTVPGAVSPEFVAATCSQLRDRAAFEPARDAAGESRPDYYLGIGLLFAIASAR